MASGAGAGAVAVTTGATSADVESTQPDVGDRTAHLSADDVEAEEEELEMEEAADIDLTEGPTSTTIT